MKKQLISEITRLKEIMGLKPQLLMEGGVSKPLMEFLQQWYKKGTKNKTFHDGFLYLLKSADEVGEFNAIARGDWEAAATQDVKDLSGIWKADPKIKGDTDIDAFLRGLDDDLMSPNEAEMLMRVIKHGDKLDDMVKGMTSSPSLMRHFKELFPGGKPDPKIIAREMNTDVDDELVLVLTRQLKKELPKIQVTNPLNVPSVKIKGKQLGGFTIPALKVKIPRFIYAFNYNNIARVVWTKKFWKRAGMWVFGLGIASEISKVIQKKIGVGAWDKPKGVDYINPFSPAFYLDKVAQKTEMNDTAWLDANLLSETKLENIIAKLDKAGVGAYADFDTDDDAIVKVYAEDIKTRFQAAQVANEWLVTKYSNLEEDIISSMNFPIQIISTDWLGGIATSGINSILPDWAGDVDWTDTNITEIYNIIKAYNDYFDEDGNAVREDTGYTMGEKELKKFYMQIKNYPPKLRGDGGQYCTTRGFKILPAAWIPLVADQPSWQEADQYIKNMKAEKFNQIHKDAVGDGVDVYIISEDGDCNHIELTTPSESEYKKNVEEYFNVVKDVIKEGPEDEG
jgi:hypothetical protein